MITSSQGRRWRVATLARRRPGELLSLALRKIVRSFVEYHNVASFKIKAAAGIGVIGFPLFYFVWTYIFPQPYENLTLRIVGMLLSLNMLLFGRYAEQFWKYRPLIFYISLIYCIPFFFTYMLLMNGAGIVWQLTIVSGLLYLVLLSDAINSFVIGVIGTLLAFVAYAVSSGGQPVPQDYIVLLPVLAFVYCGIWFLNYNNELLVKEKLQATTNIAAHMAHEMRTPLLGVKLDAEQAARTLPRLLEAYDWAKANGWDGRVAKSQRDGMTSALKRIALHADSANVVIEMLLANAALDNRQTTLTPCSMSAIVQAAIDRYIFKGNQRVLVTTDLREDFMFRGSEALMTHTFFNLMKNSLRAVEKTGHGEITITVRREGTNGIVDFADTGHGMTSEQAARIFTPFFTSESLGIGNGIGLSFCRGVVERFGGTISCQSALGKGTTFRISLPVLESRHLATAETYKTDAAERSSDGTPTVVAD